MVENTNSVLFQDVSHLIESAKNQVARYTNSALVLLQWDIGQKIHLEILKKDRAEYGEKIIKQLARQLTLGYGRGFDSRALFRMLRFARQFPDKTIVETLSPLLSWSHFRELIALEDTLEQQFYTEMCRIERWSVRELRKKIDGMLYERTAISQKPEEIIKKDLAI